MNVLSKLRVYRELLTVLVSTLVALFGWQRFAPELHAAAAERDGDDDVLSAAALEDAYETASPDPSVEPHASAKTASTTATSAAAGPRPAPGHERILVLGDSMVEVLAADLQAYALENGHEIVPAIWYGSTTSAWANSAELGALVREIDPTMVVVVLGSSELTRRKIESRRPFVEALVRRAGKRKVVWIGPPNWRADTGINDLLEDVLGKDRFFRSEHLDLTRKKDGIHPDAAGGKVWMDAIAAWLETESRFQTRMHLPSRPAAAPPARVVGRM